MNLFSFLNCKSVWANHGGNERLIGWVAHIYPVFAQWMGWMGNSVEGIYGYGKGVRLQPLGHRTCVWQKKNRYRRQRKSIRDWKACHSTVKVRQVYAQGEREGHKGGERESKREEGSVRIRLEGRREKKSNWVILLSTWFWSKGASRVRMGESFWRRMFKLRELKTENREKWKGEGEWLGWR